MPSREPSDRKNEVQVRELEQGIRHYVDQDFELVTRSPDRAVLTIRADGTYRHRRQIGLLGPAILIIGAPKLAVELSIENDELNVVHTEISPPFARPGPGRNRRGSRPGHPGCLHMDLLESRLAFWMGVLPRAGGRTDSPVDTADSIYPLPGDTCRDGIEHFPNSKIPAARWC